MKINRKGYKKRKIFISTVIWFGFAALVPTILVASTKISIFNAGPASPMQMESGAKAEINPLPLEVQGIPAGLVPEGIPVTTVEPGTEPAASVLAPEPLVVNEELEPAVNAVITIQEDGNRALENFNDKNQRTQKRIYDEKNRLHERWVFDTAHEGRLVRYETYAYDAVTGELATYRQARYQYEEGGGFLKTNRLFNGKGEPSNSYIEQVNAAGSKFREEWYDAKGNIVSRKLWDSESGAFIEHLYVKSLARGWHRYQWMDENGQKYKEMDFSSTGKGLLPFKRVQFGRSLETRYSELERRKNVRNQPAYSE